MHIIMLMLLMFRPRLIKIYFMIKLSNHAIKVLGCPLKIFPQISPCLFLFRKIEIKIMKLDASVNM